MNQHKQHVLKLPTYLSTSDIANPISGMLIYLSTEKKLAFYDGTNWQLSVEPPYQQVSNKLIGTGSTGIPNQGKSVALSGDGNTLAIGGHTDNANTGAVWIFTQTAGVWTQQGSKLVGTGATGYAQQGVSVSLSLDGNTLAVGGDRDNFGNGNTWGATWIFTRTNGVWTQQGPKLVGTDILIDSRQGFSVDLSSDGDTLVVGGYGDNKNKGAVWIFTRTNDVWTQQGPKLVGTDSIGNSQQGMSVSISGNTIAVGGPGDNGNIGAIWVFTRTAGVWTQQNSKLVATGSIGNSYNGYSLAIKGDTIVSGGYTDDNNIGATWVFKRNSGTWTQQGPKLVGKGYVGTDIEQGSAVALSLDEKTLITGGGFDNYGIGAAWVFKLGSNGTWNQFNNKLIGTGYIGTPQMGYSKEEISISNDGNIFVVGGPADNSNIGATWIFNN